MIVAQIKNPCGFIIPTLKVRVTNPRGFFDLSNFYLVKLVSQPSDPFSRLRLNFERPLEFRALSLVFVIFSKRVTWNLTGLEFFFRGGLEPDSRIYLRPSLPGTLWWCRPPTQGYRIAIHHSEVPGDDGRWKIRYTRFWWTFFRRPSKVWSYFVFWWTSG